MKEECKFGYRESFFKTPRGRKYVITRVAFDLQEEGETKAGYKDVREYFFTNGISNPSIQDVRDAIIFIRTKKLPNVNEVGTAGSFFKNPLVSIEKAQELERAYPAEYALAPIFSSGAKLKIPAAWLIDKVCGLRGKRDGSVGTHERQAVAIVNYGGASSKEVFSFARHVQEEVEKKTGIFLESEVQII